MAVSLNDKPNTVIVTGDDTAVVVSGVGIQGGQGEAGTVDVGTVTTGAAGSSASVTNVGNQYSAILDFVIPRGDTGATGPQGPQGQQGATGTAATITVGSVSSSAPGGSATVTNSGTSSAAVLDFVLPRGDTGPQGSTGAAGTAATITVGSTSTGAAGSTAVVTNSGTSSAAVLNFTIPRGDTGATGAQGAKGDTGAGVAAGGSTGQVLAKKSSTDYDTEWVAQSGGISPTIIDAKGDLIVGTAADTAARLAVGTDSQVLTADSTQTGGIGWNLNVGLSLNVVNPSTGYRFIPGLIRTGWSNTGHTASNGVTYYWPLAVDHTFTFDAFAPFVNAAVASSSVRVALCTATAGWQPNALVIESGLISTATTGEKVSVVTKTTAPAGRYLVALRSDAATQYRAPSINWPKIGWGFNGADSLFFSFQHFTVNEAFGAFSSTPTQWTSIVVNSNIVTCPVMMRSAAP